MLRDVDDEVADLDELLGSRLCAAQAGADTGDELLRLEGLGDVVIRAGLKAQHDVDGVRLRGKHDDRHRRGAADGAADIHAVHAGEHKVEQNEVRLVVLKGRYGLRAVGHGNGLKPLRFQDDSEHFRDCRIIVNDQNLRGHSKPRLLLKCGAACTAPLSRTAHPLWHANSRQPAWSHTEGMQRFLPSMSDRSAPRDERRASLPMLGLSGPSSSCPHCRRREARA